MMKMEEKAWDEKDFYEDNEKGTEPSFVTRTLDTTM